MKAKYLLGALVFPMMFGACTNDIFEQEQQPSVLPDNSLLGGRATVNPVLNVERFDVENAQTRIVGDIINDKIDWKWSGKEDRLGAVVVDYGKDNAIVNKEDYPKYAITNYRFTPNIEGATSLAKFTTESAVVEGAYIFYSQYDGNLIKKSVISDEIPRVLTVNAGKEAGLKQIGSERAQNGTKIGQNMFVSPIVNISLADGQETKFPLALTSANSILHIRLKAELADKYWGNFSVNKIVLKALDNTTPFYRTLTLNPSKIADLQTEVAKENPLLAWVTKGEGADLKYVIDGTQDELTKETVNAVIRKIMSRKADNKVDVNAPVSDLGPRGGESEDLVYQLENKFIFDKGENNVFDLYVIMPAGVYKKKTGLLDKYEGVNAGALQMTVYTSEGTYNTYLGSSNDVTSLIAHRGELIDIVKTLKIKEGDTNINLYDFEKKGFDIETTEDWEYAIDYINSHLDRFGQGSTWSTPKLKLKGEEIVLNEGYYFPEYPVSYSGDATLIVNGAGDYTINAKNVILDSDHNPTIKFKNSDATVAFSNVNAKSEFNLISAAQINIAEGQALTFKKLESSKGLQVDANAKVNINSNNDVVLNGENTFATGSIVTATTTGKVTLNNATLNASTVTLAGATNETTGELAVNANAALTVTGAYTNAAEATIDGNAEMKLKGASINSKSIEVGVDGYLNASDVEFTNGTGATLTLIGEEQGMNSDSRSKADIKALINNGTIDIKEGGDKKGTYGGRLNVSASIVNNAGADINVNGELFATAATGTNYGKITLMDDEYAVIQLAGSKFSSVNEGYILLSAPANYEMFNSYYTVHNQLTSVKGAIVANLDQATFNKVFENYKSTTLGSQERAWQVINKVNVEGDVEFTTVYLASGKKVAVKDFILNNSKFIAKDANMTIGSLTVNGKSAFETKVPTIITVNKVVSVEESSDFSVAEDVTMNIKPISSTMLTVNGTMTNYGQINTIASTNYGKPNYIRTIINENGKLVNHGTLSQKSTSVYSTASAEYKTLKTFVNDYNKGTDNIRVEVIAGTTSSISGSWSNSEVDVDKATLAKILSQGKAVMIGTYQALVIEKDASNVYALYLGGTPNEVIDTEEFNKARTYDLTKGEVTLADYVTGAKSNPTDAKTWFYVSYNYGTLELAEDGQAWGEIVNNKGYKKGDFENE